MCVGGSKPGAVQHGAGSADVPPNRTPLFVVEASGGYANLQSLGAHDYDPLPVLRIQRTSWLVLGRFEVRHKLLGGTTCWTPIL